MHSAFSYDRRDPYTRLPIDTSQPTGVDPITSVHSSSINSDQNVSWTINYNNFSSNASWITFRNSPFLLYAITLNNHAIWRMFLMIWDQTRIYTLSLKHIKYECNNESWSEITEASYLPNMNVYINKFHTKNSLFLSLSSKEYLLYKIVLLKNIV